MTLEQIIILTVVLAVLVKTSVFYIVAHVELSFSTLAPFKPSLLNSSNLFSPTDLNVAFCTAQA